MSEANEREGWREALDSLAMSVDRGDADGWEVDLVRRRVEAALRDQPERLADGDYRCANCGVVASKHPVDIDGPGAGQQTYCERPERDVGVPRRVDVRRWTPAEHAIQDAVDSVEAMGADERLTDAVVLLSDARRAVADYVDGVRRTSPTPAPEGALREVDTKTLIAAAEYIEDAAEGESDFYRDKSHDDDPDSDWWDGAAIAARLRTIAARTPAPEGALREAERVIRACEANLRLVHEANGPVPKDAPMPEPTFVVWQMASNWLAARTPDTEGGRDDG